MISQIQESDSDIALWVKKRASGAYKGTDENLELSVLLSKLDDNKHMCGDVVEAEKLLHTAVSKRHPRLIQVGKFEFGCENQYYFGLKCDIF